MAETEEIDVTTNWQGQNWNDGTDWSPDQPSGFTTDPTLNDGYGNEASGPSFVEPGASYPSEPYPPAPYSPAPYAPSPYAPSPMSGTAGYPSLYGTRSVFGPAYEYANWGQRVLASLIDEGGLIAAYIIGMIMASLADGSSSGEDAAATVWLVLTLIGYSWFVYSRYIYGGSTGQSYGRKVVGIRLLSTVDGRPIGGGLTFVRDLAHALDSWSCYLGWLWPLWDEKRQTFADKVMSTHVVLDQGLPANQPQPW